MNPRSTTTLLALALAALTGCGAEPSTPPTAVGVEDTRAAWLEAAKCMRANGYPDFPDPVQEGGVWAVSTPIPPPGPAACAELIRNAKRGTNAGTEVSAEEMNQLRLYAKCMRDNGVRGFPDPDEDGNYGPIQSELESSEPAFRTAKEACKQYAPPQRPK